MPELAPPLTAAWVVYDYDTGPYAISLHASAEDAARGAAHHGYGRIARWPFGMELRDAIEAFNSAPAPPVRPPVLPNPVQPSI